MKRNKLFNKKNILIFSVILIMLTISIIVAINNTALPSLPQGAFVSIAEGKPSSSGSGWTYTSGTCADVKTINEDYVIKTASRDECKERTSDGRPCAYPYIDRLSYLFYSGNAELNCQRLEVLSRTDSVRVRDLQDAMAVPYKLENNKIVFDSDGYDEQKCLNQFEDYPKFLEICYMSIGLKESPIASEGELCYLSGDVVCGENLRCIEVTEGSPRGTCEKESTSSSGLGDGGTMLSMVGESCNDDLDCAEGVICTANKICWDTTKDSKAKGDACLSSTECQGTLICDSEICKEQDLVINQPIDKLSCDDIDCGDLACKLNTTSNKVSCIEEKQPFDTTPFIVVGVIIVFLMFIGIISRK